MCGYSCLDPVFARVCAMSFPGMLVSGNPLHGNLNAIGLYYFMGVPCLLHKESPCRADMESVKITTFCFLPGKVSKKAFM